jgi:hypothetical protein
MTEARSAARQVRLRAVEDHDLGVFFDHQADPEATEMAAFPARGKDQFAAHWARTRADATVIQRTIVADGTVAGYVASWEQDGQRQLAYESLPGPGRFRDRAARGPISPRPQPQWPAVRHR